MKYLLIKNWHRFQPPEKLKNENASLPWIKDYTNKEFDADYMGLKFFQRYVLDALCRLRGRLGHDIPYDNPTWVARLLHATPKDAPHIPHAIRTLVARGFLAEQNVQLPSREGEGDIESGELGEGEGEDRRLAASPSQTEEANAKVSSKSKAASVGEVVQ